jgi:hypothetical protein
MTLAICDFSFAMKPVLTLGVFAFGAKALNGLDICCFKLTADTSSTPGTIGQLNDGQDRLGGRLLPTEYCMDSNGAIFDSNGRECILSCRLYSSEPS